VYDLWKDDRMGGTSGGAGGLFSSHRPGRRPIRNLRPGHLRDDQDIQADNTGTVHLVWTSGSTLNYGRVVNHAVTGRVEVANGREHALLAALYFGPAER